MNKAVVLSALYTMGQTQGLENTIVTMAENTFSSGCCVVLQETL